MKRKCLVCEKGELIKVKGIILEINGYRFILKGERCTNCNEEFPYEEAQRAIETSRRWEYDQSH